VAKAAGALAQGSNRVQQAAARSWRDVVDYVVGVRRITGDPANQGHARGPPEVVEGQSVTNPPGDEVVGARCIAADADPAYLYATGSI